MAKIKLSAIIPHVSGSIGGSVIQRSKAGYILKNKSFNNPLKSLRSQKRNSIFAFLSYKWDKLSKEQRRSWSIFAKFHNLKMKSNSNIYLSGKEAFIKCNYLPLTYNYNILESPAFLRHNYNKLTVDLYLNHSDLSIETSRPLNSLKEFIVLYCSKRVKGTVNNVGNRYKLIIFDSGSGGIVSIEDSYIEVFGIVPKNDDYVFFKWQLINKENYIASMPYSAKIQIENRA